LGLRKVDKKPEFTLIVSGVEMKKDLRVIMWSTLCIFPSSNLIRSK
jgi:hypothetical protein